MRPGLDLSSRAGALRFAELRRAELSRYFEVHGRLKENPIAYVFARYDYERGDRKEPVRRGRKFDAPVALPCPTTGKLWDLMGDRTTLFIGYVLREMAKATKTAGVLLFMDSWAAPTLEPREGEYGWVAKQSDKIECLFGTLEHEAIPHRMRWVSRISRGPLKLEPWEEIRGTDGGSPEGRLEGMVDWRS